MAAGVFGNTVNLNFNLIEFDYATWHDLEYANWRTLDAYLGTYVGINGVQGPWANATAYTVGQRVADITDGKIYQCEVAHTSASSPTTFSTDRSNNPTYWSEMNFRPVLRGAWTTGLTYYAGDFVHTNSGLIYAVALTEHTAGATFAGDSSKWSNIIDGTAVSNLESQASTSATNAAASASAASTSASNAATSESNASSSASAASTSASNASTSETNAGTSATNAAASASNASTSATNASTSASGASTSATNASSSATSASTAQTAAETAQTAAEAAKDLAEEWSSNPEDVAITGNPGKYSALHWSAKAESASTDADTLDGLDSTAFAQLGAASNLFQGTVDTYVEVRAGAVNNDAELRLMETSTLGFRWIYDGALDSIFLESTTGGFASSNTVALSCVRGSAVVDFKATPTVNATAVSLSGHSHVIADVTNLQTTLDGKAASSHTHSNATTSVAGFMSAADKDKLDDLPSKKPVFAMGRRTSTLSISNNTTTVVTWNAEDDPDSILNGGTGKFVAPTGARFAIVSLSLAWSANSTGFRILQVQHEGDTRARTRTDAASPLTQAEAVVSAGPFPVTAGDEVYGEVYQNSGGSLNVASGTYITMSVGFFF